MRRMWINQPSGLQDFHDLHGTNVLVDDDKSTQDDRYVKIYFLDGPIISQMIDRLALSDGWRTDKS